VRTFVVIAVILGGGVWGVLHHLPEGDAAAAPTGTPDVVRSVALDGHGLPVTALRGGLGTRVGTTVDATQLERDRAALVAALAQRGYLRARVAPAHVAYDAHGAYVTFAIDQGKLFHVRSVVVRGASSHDTEVVTLSVGDAALADRIELAREALADRLAARSKKTDVALHVSADDATAAIDVELVAK
jgi:outer membrane protein assembly factor BamA